MFANLIRITTKKIKIMILSKLENDTPKTIS